MVGCHLRALSKLPRVGGKIAEDDRGFEERQTGEFAVDEAVSDGSILSVFTFFQGSTRILTVTRSTDGGQTFGAWGTIAPQNNDCDNPNIIQRRDGSLVARSGLVRGIHFL
jgi:hypothetical protein